MSTAQKDAPVSGSGNLQNGNYVGSLTYVIHGRSKIVFEVLMAIRGGVLRSDHERRVGQGV
jgi:hypothetical protein